MNRSREFSQLPDDRIKFGFAVGQYHGPVSDPTYRQEVIDYDLEDTVEDLLIGAVPERFSWMQPVVDDQIANHKINKPLRFMSVVSELVRAQAEPNRDLDYENQVAALGSLLYDSCDENFNYLGVFIKLRAQDSTIHAYEWGNLKLNPDTQEWHMSDELPLSEIEEVVRRPRV